MAARPRSRLSQSGADRPASSLADPAIVVCEPQCWGFEHAHFNASLLDTVLLAYPAARVVFLGETEHLSCVRAILAAHDADSAARVDWRAMPIPPREMLGWRRFTRELAWVRAALRIRARFVLLCSVTGPGLVAVKSFGFVRRPRGPILAVMHSVLRTAFEKQSLRPSTWILSMRHAMALPHRGLLRYITLGAPIHRKLVATAPKLARNFASVEMPQLVEDLSTDGESQAGTVDAVRFGFLGVANAVKRIDVFARLAADAHACVPAARAEFAHVGFLNRSDDRERLRFVTGVSVRPLSTEEYRRRALELTYVVSTADPAHYQMIGSATFLDALAFGKPGVYLRNPFLEYYFELFGDIGYLCDSYEDMLNVVTGIVRQFPATRYRQQCANIRRGREHFAPRNIAAQMRRVAEAVDARATTLV